jgi:hypothetical protein
MKKLLTAFLILLFTQPCWAVTQWTLSVPTGAPATTDLKSNFPAEIYAQWTILDTLLSNYRRAMYLTYASSSSLTVGIGEVVVSTAGISPRLFLQNTSALTLTTANLDTGSSFVVSTTYYVYAGTTSATASTATGYISLSNTAPAGVTYYALLGSFTTDSNGNISQIIDNTAIAHLGAWTTPSANTVYQATTDGFFTGYSADCGSSGGNQILSCITDSNSTPTTVRSQCSSGGNIDVECVCTVPVKKGDYWKFSDACIDGGPHKNAVYWIPLGQ